jgi:hypothetical protein
MSIEFNHFLRFHFSKLEIHFSYVGKETEESNFTVDVQVIIHAKEMESHGIGRFNFTDHLRNDLEFGPIFNKKFLKGRQQ